MAASRSIVWSPHADRSQFLVSGAELKLYEWIPENEGTPARAQFLSSIPNITLMMCVDWSPDPYCQDLIAVGLTTGKTLLVRMGDYALPESSYPYNDNSTALRNNVNVPARPQKMHNSGTQQYPVLGVKLSRQCNVVSFSKSHPHLLATGLEKVRNDPCLLVWDISQAIDSYCNTPSGSQTPTTTHHKKPTSQDAPRSSPIGVGWNIYANDQQHPIASSIPARPKHEFLPNNFVAQQTGGPSNAPPYREQKPLYQFGSSEAIASCAWSVHGGSPLLIAGMANKYLRVYDIRVDSGASPLQFSTKAVYGITVDPFNPYRVASFADESVIRLWDTRKPTESILTLNADSSSKNSISRIAFSPTRAGILASLSRDGYDLNLWDIQETITSSRMVMPSISDQRSSPANNPIYAHNLQDRPSSRTGRLERTASSTGLARLANITEDDLSIPVLWKNRKTPMSSKPLTSFAFIPNSMSDRVSESVQRFLTMHKDGQFEAVTLQDACKISWQACGGMAMTADNHLLMYDSKNVVQEETAGQESLEVAFDQVHLEEQIANSTDGDLDKSQKPRMSVDRIRTMFNGSVAKELASDISVLMRKRVIDGYSMDCTKNIEIVKKDRKLRELWSWMERADAMSKGSAQIGNIDYSFQGVYGIWMGPVSQGRRSSPGSTPKLGGSGSARQNMGQKGTQKYMSKDNQKPPSPIAEVAGKADTGLAMVQTAKMAQRQLALAACGLRFNATELETQLIRLESNGEYDKAAGWALFHGLPERAIQALSSVRGDGQGEDDRQRKWMSAVLAGYQIKNSQENTTWRQLCESLSNDMVDHPYLRAIFAYIASNDWYCVLNEPELPLRERMAVALRVLDDEQMTRFLNVTLDELIQQGDMEGVVVTGLTTRGVDLFDQALNRYGDVQTASMVMSFVVPRRFKDKRVEDWVEDYRSLLDRWQLWHSRAKFDIQRGKRMNASEIAPPQVYVRCTHCAQSVGHSLLIQNVRNRDGKRMNVQTNISSAGGRMAGKQKSTVCPSCRKPLPRCALCLQHMGTPSDSSRQMMANNDIHHTDASGFDLWFTWCQTCRHGGHAMHMSEWFQKHSICPVSDCSCQCQF
ncbi:uncharacterized protein BYT42DRAFT_578520 [Radiomyces spectabilis]|uniref:uncharacterized protein n=1 Tax=Radiomyces spectabilis TaxID=64574 RepID=UPI00222117C2|nr:uncharacterized protein BYT42DRAFT_578520 [Radiomyces spectabilis]KAI8372909.1 hypothetical protein BYT42DRAFT_578520 [Radiomyces spectabilis]